MPVLSEPLQCRVRARIGFGYHADVSCGAPHHPCPTRHTPDSSPPIAPLPLHRITSRRLPTNFAQKDNVYLILVKTHNQTFRKTYGTHSGKNMLEVQCTVGWRQAFKNYVSNVFAGLEMRDRVAPRTRQGQRHRGSSNAQRARRGLANSPETCLKKKTVTAGRSMLNLRCATGGCEEGRDGGWRRLVAAPRGCTTCVHGKQAMR